MITINTLRRWVEDQEDQVEVMIDGDGLRVVGTEEVIEVGGEEDLIEDAGREEEFYAEYR